MTVTVIIIEKSYRLCICMMNDIAFLFNIFNSLDLFKNCSDGLSRKIKMYISFSVAAIMTVTTIKMENIYRWCI